MYRKIIGLIGAMTAFVAPQAVRAQPAATPSATEVLNVQSYGDLLDPIPNAASVLRAIDSAPRPARVQKVQYYGQDHHHHHHHHHHNGYWGGYGYGNGYGYGHHHHHHHHHHNGYWGNGW
ncbi:MAG: hypothetical protein ACYC5H_12675 [Methylovirgula sp.]